MNRGERVPPSSSLFLPDVCDASSQQPDSPSLLPAAVADAWTQASQEPIVVKDDDGITPFTHKKLNLIHPSLRLRLFNEPSVV